MSSVHVLLSSLQDRSKCGGDAYYTMLQELLSFCRYDEIKSEIVAHGIGPLVALATDESLSASADIIDALLELLNALAFDNHAAKVVLAHKGALQVAIGVLHQFGDKKPSKKRNKIVKQVLDLVEQCSNGSSSSIGRDNQIQKEQLYTFILQILNNVSDDCNVLLHTAEVLGHMLERSVDSIHTVAKLDGIAILLRLLTAPGDNMDVKRSVCEVLLIMGDATGVTQMLASDNIVHALAVCLRVPIPGRDVESTVIRLLARLSEEAQVYGQIINEEMMPLLFQVVGRNCNLLGVAWPACTILERLSRFARDCKFDLSSYLQDAPCPGKVLINTATCHAHVAKLVLSVFGFFVNISCNPVDLLLLVNSDTIEGLLALYILNGSSGNLSSLSTDLVQVVSSLSRSTVETITLNDDDKSLPSLFLCLRNHYGNLRFASQVFVILTKYWKQQGSFEQKTREFVAGSGNAQVGDRSRLVCQASTSSLPAASDTSKIANALICLLERAITVLPEQSVNDCVASSKLQSSHLREGDKEYEEYVTKILRRERSCLFKTFDTGTLNPSSREEKLLTPSPLASQPRKFLQNGSSQFDLRKLGNTLETNTSHESDRHASRSDSDAACADVDNKDTPEDEFLSASTTEDAELENDADDDDGSDDDDVTDEVDIEGFAEGNQSSVEVDEALGDLEGDMSNNLSEVSPPKSFVARGWSPDLDISHFEDKKFYFLSPSGVKYPRHPSRYKREADAATGGEQPSELLLLDEPSFTEPCRVSTSEEMNAFVEQATLRKDLFMQSDPYRRAKLVYESTSCFENPESTNDSGTRLGPKVSVVADPFPYFVPKQSYPLEEISKSLTFDSCFESGNLERAVQIGEYEYDLCLRRDFNTNGHTQWFYFAVSNIQITPGTHKAKYRFNIVNLCKPDSLFNQGLQPVVYSVKDAKLKRTGWLRSGSEIYYFGNPFPRLSKCTGKVPRSNNDGTSEAAPPNSAGKYYTLTLTLEFADADDTYLIAHSYPYTFSDHQQHLEQILHQSGRRIRATLRHSVLCKTLSGKSCDLLSISDFSAGTQELKARKAIVISSRVHPGEPQASWMMRGVIDFLLGESDVARVLRRLFLFQIIPMLNPDGVYYGNSRCALSACDLNRQWHNPSQSYHPTIFHAKELLKKECATRGVVFFCDIHGHSRKKNVFMYGCDTKKRPNPRARAFAKLFSMQQNARKYISFPDCSFKISKSKEATARVVIANELKLAWSFTLEASFCGGDFGELQGMHYNTRHMHQVGSSMCETLFQACINDGSIRERLAAMVDDRNVCIPGYVEVQLRECGSATDAAGMSGYRRDSREATPRKAKVVSSEFKKSTETKLLRQRSSSGKSASFQVQEPLSTKAKTPPDHRKLERKQDQRSRQRLQNTPPADLLDGNGTGTPQYHKALSVSQAQDFVATPRAKMSGKKLRNKKTKKKRSVCEKEKCATDTAMPAINSSFSYVQEIDNLSAKVHALGRGSSSSSNGSTNSNDSATPLAPLGEPSASCISPTLRGLSLNPRLADSMVTISAKPGLLPSADAHLVEIQSREIASVILPPPISDPTVRSPKLKSASVRFRSAECIGNGDSAALEYLFYKQLHLPASSTEAHFKHVSIAAP
ncbi:Metalloprotease family m14a, partial [Globisporangium splendens]